MKESWDCFLKLLNWTKHFLGIKVLCFQICGHLSSWSLVWSLPNVLLSYHISPFPVSLTTTWFQPHWSASLCWLGLMLGLIATIHMCFFLQDPASSCCLAMQPCPLTSLGSLAFFTSLSTLQPHNDGANCSRSLEPTCSSGRTLILVTKEALFSFQDLKYRGTNPSDASECTGSEMEVVVPLTPSQ